MFKFLAVCCAVASWLVLSSSVAGAETSQVQAKFSSLPNALNRLSASDRIPIVRRPPQYPLKAFRNTVEGWVLMDFIVDESGKVTDVLVLESQPVGVFEREATRALKKWKYRPPLLNDEPVKWREQIVLSFELEGVGLTRSFSKAILEAEALIDAGNLDEALEAISKAMRLRKGSSEDEDLVDAVMGQYYFAKGQDHLAMNHLRMATSHLGYGHVHRGVELGTLLFHLQIEYGHLLDAIYTSRTLSRIGLSHDSPVHPATLKAKEKVLSNTPLAAEGEIHRACYNCRKGSGLWRMGLSRHSLRIDLVEGKIDTLRLSCDFLRQEYPIKSGQTLSIPQEAGRCEVQLTGNIGTSFVVAEH